MTTGNTEFIARDGLTVAAGTRFRVPVGNTAQRPSSPAQGDFRFNSDIGVFEGYYVSNTSWATLAGAGLSPNTVFGTSVSVGNSSQNTFITPTTFTLGSNVFANTSGYQVSNGTVSSFLSFNNLVIGNTTINSTGFGIGNSSVSIVANSTTLSVGNLVFTSAGFAGTANNSSFLGGVAAASYSRLDVNAFHTGALLATNGFYTYGANTSQGVAYFNSGATAYLQFNGSSWIFGNGSNIQVAGATVYTTTNLTNLNQLSNGPGYITSGSLSSYAVLGSSPSFNICYGTNYLYSYGNVYAQGDVYAGYSDFRLKDFLTRIYSPLDIVDQLNAYYYYQNELGTELTGINRDKRMIGLIAQEVQEVLPEAVSLAPFDVDPDTGESKSGEDYLTIDYTKIVPLLVEAIKELRAEVNELKGRS